MIKGDSISFGLWLLALMIIIYLSTFIGFTDMLLIPFALLIGGMITQLWVNRRVPEQDPSLSADDLKSILFYVLIALAGIGLGSFLIPGLFTPAMPVELAIYDQYLYGSLYAISEERFFRGGVTSFLDWKFGRYPIVVYFGSAIIFWVYHFAVYGSNIDKLMYVLIAGVMLSYVTLKSKRITPSSLAHIINNLGAI